MSDVLMSGGRPGARARGRAQPPCGHGLASPGPTRPRACPPEPRLTTPTALGARPLAAPPPRRPRRPRLRVH
jgi:hypothetical protein